MSKEVVVCSPKSSTTWLTHGKECSFDKMKTFLTQIIHKENKWTEQCSRELELHPHAVYEFDRQRHLLGQVTGNEKAMSLFLNPLQVLCLSCKKIVRWPNKLNEYHYHLRRHNCSWSSAMMARFDEIGKLAAFDPQIFIDKNLCNPSQFALYIFETNDMIKIMNLSVRRDFEDTHYMAHWLDVMLKLDNGKTFPPHLLMYQEIDALLDTTFLYPDFLRDWSIWPTLSNFSLSLFMTDTECYNVARGYKKYPRRGRAKSENKEESNSDNEINDQKEEISTSFFLQRNNFVLPEIQQLKKLTSLTNPSTNPIEHENYLMFHLMLLMKNENSVCFENETVTRFVQNDLICDSQIFNHNGLSHIDFEFKF